MHGPDGVRERVHDRDGTAAGNSSSDALTDGEEAISNSLASAVDRLIAAPLDHEALVAMLLEQLVPAWCDAAVLDWMDDRGNVTRLGAATHGPGDVLAPLLAAVDTDAVTREAVIRVRRTGRTATSVVWTPPAADLPPTSDSEEHDGAVRWHVHSVPLRVRGTLSGTLTLLSSSRMADGLGRAVARCADRLAPTLELARLDTLELHERRHRPPDPRLQLLADVGALTAESLDQYATLQRVVSRLVPEFADIAVVERLADTDMPGRTEVVASSRQVSDAVRDVILELEREGASNRANGVTRPWRSDYIPELDDQTAHTSGAEPYRLERLGASGITSCITVPLGTHRRVAGTFSLLSARHNLRYGREDLVLAEELARRMTGVIENARLYHGSQLANLAKAEFLAVMSHELRTPLTAILGYGALLREGMADRMTETQRRHLAGIETSGVHLVGMIDEILSFVGMEAGWERVARHLTSVERLVEGAVAQVRTAASRKGVEIHVGVRAVPSQLLVDPARFVACW